MVNTAVPCGADASHWVVTTSKHTPNTSVVSAGSPSSAYLISSAGAGIPTGMATVRLSQAFTKGLAVVLALSTLPFSTVPKPAVDRTVSSPTSNTRVPGLPSGSLSTASQPPPPRSNENVGPHTSQNGSSAQV